MARVKDKNGLTYQQEQFCQHVVDAYGNDTKGILVAAYRKAYNCRNEAKANTHYNSASLLMDNPKITQRIAQLREALSATATISRERIISDDVALLDLDPLDLWIYDEKRQSWRMRAMHEIRKPIRVIIPRWKKVGKVLLPDIDKDAAKKRLIDVMGYNAAKEFKTTSADSNDIIIAVDSD